MVSIELTNWINNELPADRVWWNSDASTEFHKNAGILLARGFSVEEIKQLFTELYTAVYSEFN